MIFNDKGFALLKEFEGCKLKSYQDESGNWTIGFGHCDHVIPNMTIDQETAESWLKEDVAYFSEYVAQNIDVMASDNQFSAAVCFAFNVAGWASKPIFEHLRNGNFEEAKKHWLLYDKETIAGIKVEKPGLKRRRQAELDLFCLEEKC